MGNVHIHSMGLEPTTSPSTALARGGGANCAKAHWLYLMIVFGCI